MTVDFTNLSDINMLPWLIPLGPLLAFLIITIITNKSRLVPATDHHEYGGHHPDYDGMLVPVVHPTSRVLSIIVGMSGIVMAWLISWWVFFEAAGTHHFGEELVFQSSDFWLWDAFRMGVLVDPLTSVMLFFVPIAMLCIFIYSIGYMAHDPRQARFFSLISLFAGAMLTLVVADNLLLLFVGWEVMGLCSYLLIGFWFEKPSAYNAAIKAFTTTRVADVVMLLGIAYLLFLGAGFEGFEGTSLIGTLNFRETLHNQAFLDYAANQSAIIFGSFGMSAASLIGIFLIIGTIGKSAQFPLHVWLPDAMEGPTPVSAMIHAAAMVSAGIYAVIRMYPLFEAGGHPHDGDLTSPLMLMSIVGSFTALFAATIAVAQNDVKRVLAYSTISQLGFMMAALGIGAYIAAVFHLMTHAFFKALLFMASGSVIHAMEHGEHHVHEHHEDDEHDEHHAHADEHGEHHGHDDHAHEEHGHFDPQDMMNMGGLLKKIPVTGWTFIIGGLSLSGFPLLTAGFWSKDEILAESFYGLDHGYGPHALVFICLCLAAFLTAFYTMRQLALTFAGDPRTEEADHANLGGAGSIVSQTMQLPLIILAFFAIVTGFIGVPSDFPIFGAIFSSDHNPFHHFVGPTLLVDPPTVAFNIIPVLFSFGVALGGLGLGYLMYWRNPLKAGQPDPLVGILGEPVHKLLKNKYYIDEIYAVVFVAPAQWFSSVVVSTFLDKGVIDGFLHLVARVFTWTGDFIKVFNLWLIDGVSDGIPDGIARFGLWFRRVQTGRIQQYLLLVAAAAILIGIIFALSTGLLQAAN